ncbi:MAG: methyltransferase domain-containing protein, partial [Burkholderiaceae bacterium]
MIKNRVIAGVDALRRKFEKTEQLGSEETKEYWTQHNVTLHHGFNSVDESLEYFHWRNDQYFNYIQLMPVAGFAGRTILDFGCGPGHDLVGFGVYSKAAKIFGADLSSSSLGEAAGRLALHGIEAELVELSPDAPTLPFADAQFDHIHSSGVLHHTPDPVGILKELSRVLKPGGTMNIMVYNYDSLWVHLYVAHQRTLVENLYTDLGIRERFKHSTDGDGCPISNCYRPQEWVALCAEAGLTAEFSGAAISMHEMTLFPSRYLAIQNRGLSAESREFLLDLSIDGRGYPKYNGHYAGVDGCYR